jgi:hypothetical protein
VVTDTKILEAQGVNIWKGNTSRAFLDSCGLIMMKVLQDHLPISMEALYKIY